MSPEDSDANEEVMEGAVDAILAQSDQAVWTVSRYLRDEVNSRRRRRGQSPFDSTAEELQLLHLTLERAEAVQRRLAEQHLLLRIEAGVAAEGQIPTEHQFQQLAATTQQLVAQ